MSTDPVAEPFHPQALLARVGGDAALAAAMASLFLDEYPRYLTEVRAALVARDAAALAAAAHALKGSVSNFLAPAATQAALRVELAARAGDLESAAIAVRDLEAELSRLDPALREMIA
jgi:HPt (histidine-containing phosphotransfer) domain-containing protein